MPIKDAKHMPEQLEWQDVGFFNSRLVDASTGLIVGDVDRRGDEWNACCRLRPFGTYLIGSYTEKGFAILAVEAEVKKLAGKPPVEAQE